jgi:OmpA-OmpF porin, OOP family
MKSLTLAALAGILMLAAGCTTDLQKAQRMQAQGGTDFSRSQAGTYLAMAENQWQGQVDFTGSEHFARKSMRAARGEAVAPDVPGDKGFVPVKLGNELSAARQRLVTVLQNNATTRNPTLAARAQGAFDCWVDEAADPIFAVEGEWLDNKVQNCRRDFESAMTELEGSRPAAVSPATPAPAPAPAATAPEQSFLVFFDFDRSNLTPEAAGVARRAAEIARRGGVVRIAITGHADRSGSDAYNMALSQRRANAVRDALIREGVPGNRITTTARGETQPLVPTPDGQREPQNRRAEIVVQ